MKRTKKITEKQQNYTHAFNDNFIYSNVPNC